VRRILGKKEKRDKTGGSFREDKLRNPERRRRMLFRHGGTTQLY